MTVEQWIAFASLFLPMLYFGLNLLSHASFVAKSTAWSAIVAGAMNIVAHIEAELKANPSASVPDLIKAGIAELRSVYVDSFAKLGGTAVPDTVLTLLFQRLASRLPTAVDSAIVAFLGGGSQPLPGAASLSGGVSSVPLRRGVRFARPVGAVVADKQAAATRLVPWLFGLFLVLVGSLRRAFGFRRFAFTYRGEVLG